MGEFEAKTDLPTQPLLGIPHRLLRHGGGRYGISGPRTPNRFETS